MGYRQQLTSISPAISPAGPSSSSSSSLRSINKEELLTTGERVSTAEQKELDAEWLKIDSNALHEIRFGRHHVAQIAREGTFTPEELQDSIYAFAFDLEHNDKAKEILTTPLNYFMGESVFRWATKSGNRPPLKTPPAKCLTGPGMGKGSMTPPVEKSYCCKMARATR